jgi:peptidyl-prolyl cis-trans isomerase C
MKILRYCIACIVVSLAFGINLAVATELAKVDGLVINDSDFLKRVQLLPERNRINLDKERFLDKMIDEELILREAQKLNLYDREDYKLMVETYKRELLVDLYLQQYLKNNNTEENQKKYYEANKAKYMNPEMVRISVIRVQSEEEAKEIIKKAQEGEDFAELAVKYSKGPAADRGGDLGFRAKKALRKEYADVSFSMKKGDIRGPIKAEDGYHIIKVTDRQEEGVADFESVKTRVANEYRKKLLEEKISELRKAAKIQIDSAGLKNLNIKAVQEREGLKKMEGSQ